MEAFVGTSSAVLELSMSLGMIDVVRAHNSSSRPDFHIGVQFRVLVFACLKKH